MTQKKEKPLDPLEFKDGEDISLKRVDRHEHTGADSMKVSYNNLSDVPDGILTKQAEDTYIITSEIQITFLATGSKTAKANGTDIDTDDANVIVHNYDDVAEGTIILLVEGFNPVASGGSTEMEIKTLLNDVAVDTTSIDGTGGAWETVYSDTTFDIETGDVIKIRAVIASGGNANNAVRLTLKGGKVLKPTNITTTYP